MGTGDHAKGYPCDGLASHPGRSSNIPSRFMLRKPELSAGLMSHLARKQTLPLPMWMLLNPREVLTRRRILFFFFPSLNLQEKEQDQYFPSTDRTS